MRRPAWLALLTFLAAAGLAGTARADVAIFATGDFLPGEWSSHVSAGSTGSGNAFTEPAGGNPGAYRRVSLTVDPFETILDSQLWSVATFAPVTQGAVTSVSLSYDVTRVFSSDAAASQVAKGVSVRQGGTVYTQLLGVSVVSPPVWENVAVADLVTLFPAVDWSAGTAITFGFYNSVSTSGAGFTIDGGYDNYRVAVSFVPIPEPAVFASFGAGLALLLAARNLRSRRLAGRRAPL
jgi:hypothetical protein